MKAIISPTVKIVFASLIAGILVLVSPASLTSLVVSVLFSLLLYSILIIIMRVFDREDLYIAQMILPNSLHRLLSMMERFTIEISESTDLEEISHESE